MIVEAAAKHQQMLDYAKFYWLDTLLSAGDHRNTWLTDVEEIAIPHMSCVQSW